jgi:hypothetical protein
MCATFKYDRVNLCGPGTFGNGSVRDAAGWLPRVPASRRSTVVTCGDGGRHTKELRGAERA